MSRQSETPLPLSRKDFETDQEVRWCPGCGDFAILSQVQKLLPTLGIPRENFVVISGIGCSSRIPGYTTAYGFNSVHGRALPIAQGIKLAHPELLVLVAGGDGDGFSIGGGHVPHAIRRNVDLTYILMDNQIYGLTKGQLSPTSPRGSKTASTAHGSLEDPVNPLLYVLGYGAGYVAQGTPADMAGLAEIIEEGIRYPGFAFINVQSPCVTFGEEEQQLSVQKQKMQKLKDLGHDRSDRLRAMALAQEYGIKLYTGVFYRNPDPPMTYEAAWRDLQKNLAGQAKPAGEILSQFQPS